MQILLDRHLFHLNQDIKLKLEKGEDYWILKADDYLIHQKKSDSFFHETAICDGLNVNIVRGPDNVTILAYKNDNPFETYRKYPLNPNQIITIGHDKENTICYRLENYVSHRPHCVIELRGGQAFLIDSSTNGTYVNYVRVQPGPENQIRLKVGDSIRIFQLNIIYLGNMIAVRAREGAVISMNTLSAEQIDHRAADIRPVSVPAVQEFHRAPRILPQLNTEKIEIEAPPVLQESMQMPLISTIGPAFTMAIPMLISGGFTIWASRQTGNSTSLFMYTGIIMALASACIGVMWALINMRNHKKRMEEYENKRQDKYREYLAKIWDRLESDREQNRLILNRCYVDVG